MNQELLDLDPDSRHALEFDSLLEVVASYASTGLGSARVMSLLPAASESGVSRRIRAVGETGNYLEAHGKLIPGHLPDPHPALAVLDVEDARVDAVALRDLAVVLDAAGDVGTSLRRLGERDHPVLSSLGDSVPDLRDEARDVLRHLEPDGTLSDDASAELRKIRRSVARVGEQLRSMLESFLRSPGADILIQDQFITQRNGRFVIPVRADAPRQIRGIVHASSSSGATLFIEPLRSVDLNNERVRLAELEAEEQDRILSGWTDRFRHRREECLAAVAGLARVDSLQARALFGRETGGCAPVTGDDGVLELKDVRHPLLDRRLGAEGGRCVPVTLRLEPSDRVLLISGPNAGGKTVALKTLGLAVLMAQTGIPIPAARASLPLFVQMRADIGDHQSIDADLSTFSAHVQAIARFAREARTPALFLFDEIGTGTEPAEGAALAQAVLESLLTPGMTTAATTHKGALKAWAITEPQAVSAAMEFDRETLKPTYRILMKTAGVSAGLEIAGRIGIDREVLDRARELLGSDARRTEEYLDRIRTLAEEMEAARLDLDRERDDLDRARSRQRQDLDREVERIRKEAAASLEKALEEFRELGRREVRRIHGKRERERAKREQAAAERRMKSVADRTAGSVARRSGEPADSGDGGEAPELLPGARILVRSLDRTGEIVRILGRKVEVRLGTVGFTVDRSDLAPAPPGEDPRTAGATPAATARPLRGGAGRDDVGAASPSELMLIGKTVDEALPLLDKFLDDAALTGHGEVRVIHGHGTGRLRNAVRGHLRGHPHAASHRPGRPAEGGDGATVVRIS